MAGGRALGVYGAVEAAIGIWALLFPLAFAAVRARSLWLPASLPGVAFALDVALSALLIVPPTVLMGGTIPLLTQALARSLDDSTRIHVLSYPPPARQAKIVLPGPRKIA